MLCGRACGRAFCVSPRQGGGHAGRPHPFTQPGTHRPGPQASPQAVAERGSRNSRSSALKHVSCDYRGVLILWGCLLTYSLTEVAQEVVTRQFGDGERLENRIEVVRYNALAVRHREEAPRS